MCVWFPMWSLGRPDAPSGDPLLIVDDRVRAATDDVLATGGTAQAKAELVKQLRGEVVGLAFLIELVFLGGRSKVSSHDVFSLIRYE